MTTAVILLILAAIAAAFPWLIRIGFRAPRVVEQGSPRQYGLACQEVSIPTENGKRLFAWFIPSSSSNSAPAVAVLHGWGGNAEMMLPLALPLQQAGYAVLLLDARNHGRSDSDNFSSLPRFAEDLEHALDWLALQPGVDASRLIALGHSVGAGAALLVASQRHDLAAVVSIAAFADPESMMRRFLAAHHIPYFPLGRYVLHYVQHAIGHRFNDIAPRHTIRQISCPVLLVHGRDDSTVPVDDALSIYAQRPGDRVRLLILAGNHDSTHEAERHAGDLVDFLDQATGQKTGIS
ncbi:MAG: alpha/beta fold hydrolase [Sulfuricella sp.]|nr:alpha/beta fold hydrolase [Sulfuricella sp.]